jgi:hypothetical protein
MFVGTRSASLPPLHTNRKESKMKFAMLFLCATAVGCAAETDAGLSQPSTTSEDVSDHESMVTDQGDLAATGWETTTTYFAEPQHLTIVGECDFRTCIPKGRTCVGTTSRYTVVVRTPCI